MNLTLKRKVVGLAALAAIAPVLVMFLLIITQLVGQTGYVYVLAGQGAQPGLYIISKDGTRDGENIYDSREAEAAAYVQSLLPPALEGRIETQWRFIPSTQLGGDAFGYHWLDDDHFCLFLLDVCGHGVGAALLSISAMG